MRRSSLAKSSMEMVSGLGTRDSGLGDAAARAFEPSPSRGELGGDGFDLTCNDYFEASIMAVIRLGSMRVARGANGLMAWPSNGARAASKRAGLSSRNSNARVAVAGTAGESQIVSSRK